MESSLSLSLWNSRNRRSYVSRISTTSDFQSSYASNPRSLIESTPQTSIFEFVSLSPSWRTIERTQFLRTSTVSFRFRFRESRSRRIYESISDSAKHTRSWPYSRLVSFPFLSFFFFSPHFESKESKSFRSKNWIVRNENVCEPCLVISHRRVLQFPDQRVIRRNEKSILRRKRVNKLANEKEKEIFISRLSRG